MHCGKCEFCSQAKNPFILGKGKTSARIMFIGDNPDEIDDNHGMPFYGKSCKAFRKSLEEKLNIDIDNDVYFTHIVKCYSDTEVTFSKAKTCSKYLEAEIEAIDPEILVPMGKNALKFCIGKNTLLKLRGNAQTTEIVGKQRIIVPMLHPKSALIKPLYQDYIKLDLATLRTIWEAGEIPEADNVTYKYLETLEDVSRELRRMKKEANVISFDVETTGLDAFGSDSRLICISLTDKTRYGVTIPLHHRETPFNKEELEEVTENLKDLLEDESTIKIAHNGAFDVKWIRKHLDIEVKNFAFDTQIAHYIAVSEEAGTQGLKHLAWEFTDMGGYDNDLDEYKSKLPESKQENYGLIPWDILKVYAAADVDCCLRLYEVFKPLIDDNPQWSTLMSDILMPISYTLVDIESNGMKLDMDKAKKYEETYGLEIKRIEDALNRYPEVIAIERERRNKYLEREAIKQIPPKERTEEEKQKFKDYAKYKNLQFNWGSPAQLGDLLFNRLGLFTSVRTNKGLPSTNEDAMNELKEQHDIPYLLLERKKIATLKNMFINKLPALIDSEGLIHPSFNVTGTVTGRLSSSNPNAQQIPRKVESPDLFQYQNEPKALFVSRFGEEGCILNSDFSALEMRIAAVISKDKTLEELLLGGLDLHKSTASKVWNIPFEEVDKDKRTAAKAVNFGVIYGKSGVTFAQDLYYDPSGKNPKKTSDWEKAKKQGLELVDNYLNTFRGLRDWIENTKKNARKTGYVQTMFGRRRRLPDLRSKVQRFVSDAERQAINAPIQGTGSDLTLLSMIHINNYLKETGKKTCLICTVHDSLVIDVYIPELHEVGPKIIEIMEHVHEPYIDTKVPITADLELGDSYGSVFEVSVEEVEKIKTIEDFKNWNKAKKLEKYKNEVSYFHKNGKPVEELLSYLQNNGRPLKELSSIIVETYKEVEHEG